MRKMKYGNICFIYYKDNHYHKLKKKQSMNQKEKVRKRYQKGWT